jgi:hypothetical protein
MVLMPLWAMAFALVSGHAFGWWGVGGVLLASVLAFLFLPLAERLEEDFQAIRGFLRRRDTAVPYLLEARRRLLDAFPGLED